MKKCLHVVYINDYFPELWNLTLPTIENYAKRIGADLNIITERKFPEMHIHYEKMQVWNDGKEYDANFLLDCDILINDGFPDFTTIVPRGHVGFNDNYHASNKYNIKENIYFQRDGRDVGIASNAVIGYKETHDIFKPIVDFTMDKWNEISTVRVGDIDEYVLSYNLAKYGLKYTGITWLDWQRYYFVHLGTEPRDECIETAKTILTIWKNSSK